VSAWQQAIAAARRVTMLYEEGLAHLELGRHLPPGDPARGTSLAEARAIFARLGAAYDLAQVPES
jgi:hypothetical protein